MNKPRVAVIGTGIMGAGMAERLLDQGFSVDVWDRTPVVAARVAERGAIAHAEAQDAVRAANVVITMLPTAPAVSEVMLGQKVLEAMRPNGIWAQMATVGLDAVETLVQEVAKRRPDVDFVDAPVSGTREPARNGQLVILASGAERVRATAQPVFEALGQRVLWLGSAGMGMRLKLILNTWLAFEIELAAEIRETAERLGVPYDRLVDTLHGSPMASALAVARLDKMQKADDTVDFPLEWALKDLDLTAAGAGADAVPIGRAIADRWRGLVAQGLGRRDVTAVRLGFAAVGTRTAAR